MLVVTGDEATIISSDAGLCNSNRFPIEGGNYFSPFPARRNLRTLWNMVKACAVLNVVTGRLSPAGRPISWECAKSVATLLDGLRAKVGKHDSRPAANNMGTSVVALYTAREQTTGGWKSEAPQLLDCWLRQNYCGIFFEEKEKQISGYWLLARLFCFVSIFLNKPVKCMRTRYL